MHPEVVALFRELADRTRVERERIYRERQVPGAIRLELESLLRYDRESAHSLTQRVAAAAQNAFADDRLIGATISRYRILERLGSGGFGVVYKARDVSLGRLVALKLLSASVGADPHALDRFRREASSASALNHPHVCTIHDIGHDDGREFIVMELLEGKTLKEHLLDGSMPVEDVLAFGVQIADALAAVHAAGIIHRDIKPANIFITSYGQAKLLDFGVAKLAAAATSIAASNRASTSRETDLTHAGTLVGTPGYMSPEQAHGLDLDARSDLFSFGAVLYEALCGTAAFQGGTPAEMVDAINATPPPMSALGPAAPHTIVAIVNRALEKDPECRYQTAAELAAALQSCRSAEAVAYTAPSRVRARRLATYVAILLPLGGVVTWMWTRAPAHDHPPQPPLVAVRELRNLSPDATQSYFAAGMTEEIRGQLSKISELRLLSRDAVDKYRDRGIDGLAADLGVRSVVDGSVRLDRNRVRISVELIDARDRHTQWSDQYERDLADIFAVQSDVALRIARALQANLSPAERERVQKHPTDNVEAYDLYLQSLQIPPKDTAHGEDAGRKLLERALERDPRFAVAKSALAFRVYFQAARVNDDAGLDRAVGLANEAVAIDPLLASPYFVLGSVSMARGRDAEARLAFLKALEREPNYVVAMQNLAYNEFQFGRLADALLWARRAFLVSARTGNDYYHVAIPLLLLRDDETSVRWMTHAERRAPDEARIQILLAAAEMLRGARAGLTRIRRAATKWPMHFEVLQTRAEFAWLAGASDADVLTEELYGTDPGTIGNAVAESVRIRRAYFLRQRRDARADADIETVLRSGRDQLNAGNENPAISVDMAAGFALRGDRSATLDALAGAMKHGYRDYGFLSMDPIFAPLARDPGFRALIDQMTGDVAEQRQRAAGGGLLDLATLDPTLH